MDFNIWLSAENPEYISYVLYPDQVEGIRKVMKMEGLLFRGRLFRKFILPACSTLMLFSGCINDINKIKAFNPSDILPVVEAENFETTYSDSGVVRFYLKTPEMKKFELEETSFIEFPKGLLLIKYNEKREVISSISARYAKQFVKEHRWEVKNDVVATNNVGDTLKTEHLIWDEQSGRIYNNEFVKVIRPDQIITGIGFEADQNLTDWRIRNPKGPIYVIVNREQPATPDSMLKNLPVLRPVNIKNP